MTLETWLAFVLASVVVLAIPGPTALLVMSYGISGGKKAVAPVVLGVVLGDLVAISLSLLGLGAVIATSASGFHLLKWAAAAYLIYLGVKRWRQAAALKTNYRANDQENDCGHPSMGLHAFAVTVLNPKSIAFFVAFLPHFIDPGKPLAPQWILLAGSFLFLAATAAGCYGYGAHRIRGLLQDHTRRANMERASALVLIGTGCMVAAMEGTAKPR